eukprot:PITA_26549
MIMQLDISKAYDKLNWTYIRKVLIAFGFDHSWVRWVMALVTSAGFSILVNGSPSEIFIPSRGLRQGDPLSHFLFILMMERLGRSIKHAKEMGQIKGLQLFDDGQALTHQQFLDDTMLQGIPMVKEAFAYKQILWDFAMASVGRLVLTKVVLQAIPVFMLSTIPAPKGVLHHFRSIQREFLWGKGEERKKWALVAWDKICKPKKHGGLGLDDLEILSKVLGEKLWWCWVKDLKAQWAGIWKGKEGDLALFWEDKWQQEPILLSEDFVDLKNETDSKGLLKVKYLWDQTNSAGKWRTWRHMDYREGSPLKEKADELRNLVEQRRILVTKGQDQLRWGNNNEGSFNLKEAKHLLELDSQVPDLIWLNL